MKALNHHACTSASHTWHKLTTPHTCIVCCTSLWGVCRWFWHAVHLWYMPRYCADSSARNASGFFRNKRIQNKRHVHSDSPIRTKSYNFISPNLSHFLVWYGDSGLLLNEMCVNFVRIQPLKLFQSEHHWKHQYSNIWLISYIMIDLILYGSSGKGR